MLAAHLLSVEGGGKAYRYGGEEFTIVFAGKDISTATVYLDNTQKLNVTVSIGIAENQAKYNSTQDIMKSADNALYKAKKKGRNRVETE